MYRNTRFLFVVGFVVLCPLLLVNCLDDDGQPANDSPSEAGNDEAYGLANRPEGGFNQSDNDNGRRNIAGPASTKQEYIIEEIHTPPPGDPVGGPIALVIGADDLPHVAYNGYTNSADGNRLFSSLFYAMRDGNRWMHRNVEWGYLFNGQCLGGSGYETDCGDIHSADCGRSLVIRADNLPLLAYHTDHFFYDSGFPFSLEGPPSPWSLPYQEYSGSLSLWSPKEDITHLDYTLGYLFENMSSTGKGLSMVREGEDHLHLVYNRSILGFFSLLLYRTIDNAASDIEILDYGDRPFLRTSLQRDSRGAAHILYYHIASPMNARSRQLWHAGNETGEWLLTPVDELPRNAQALDVLLNIDASGDLRVLYAYYDQSISLEVLKYAQRTGDDWSITDLTPGSRIGHYLGHTLDEDGHNFVTYHNLDEQRLMLLTDQNGAWQTYPLFELRDTEGSSAIAFDSRHKLHIAFTHALGLWYSMIVPKNLHN